MGYDVSFHPISPKEMQEWYFAPLAWVQQGQEEKVRAFAAQQGMEDFYAEKYLNTLRVGAGTGGGELFDKSHGFYIAVIQGFFRDYFYTRGSAFSFLVDEDNWGRKLAHIAVDVIDKDLSSMGWRSTEVGINLGGGVKIVNHLMLSCYYNIGLTQSAKHHIGGNKHDAIDQIFDGDVFESKNRYWQLSLSYVF